MHSRITRELWKLLSNLYSIILILSTGIQSPSYSLCLRLRQNQNDISYTVQLLISTKRWYNHMHTMSTIDSIWFYHILFIRFFCSICVCVCSLFCTLLFAFPPFFSHFYFDLSIAIVCQHYTFHNKRSTIKMILIVFAQQIKCTFTMIMQLKSLDKFQSYTWNGLYPRMKIISIACVCVCCEFMLSIVVDCICMFSETKAI